MATVAVVTAGWIFISIFQIPPWDSDSCLACSEISNFQRCHKIISIVTRPFCWTLHATDILEYATCKITLLWDRLICWATQLDIPEDWDFDAAMRGLMCDILVCHFDGHVIWPLSAWKFIQEHQLSETCPLWQENSEDDGCGDISEVLTAVAMKSSFFWGIELCNLVKVMWHPFLES
jgi:hypothetical protein